MYIVNDANVLEEHFEPDDEADAEVSLAWDRSAGEEEPTKILVRVNSANESISIEGQNEFFLGPVGDFASFLIKVRSENAADGWKDLDVEIFDLTAPYQTTKTRIMVSKD